MYIPNTLWTWLFFSAVLVQLIICVALEAYILAKFEIDVIPGDLRGNGPDEGHDPGAIIPTYLSIFIFGFIYQLLLTYDALRLKNTIQVIGLCIYNVGMLIYSAVEIDQFKDDTYKLHLRPGVIEDGDMQVYEYVHAALVATPCVIALFTIILSAIAWKLYGEFAWTIYKHITADLRLKRRYLQYQIYIALLKFDFFFFLAFTVQFLVVTSGGVHHDGVSTSEWAVTIAAIPVSIVLLVLAAYFTRRESYVGQTGVIGLAFAAMAYFIFKIVRMYQTSQEQKYIPVRHSLTTFAVLATVLLIVTIVAAVICLRNFNKGLKPHIQRDKKLPDDDGVGNKWASYPDPSMGGYNGSGHPLGQVPGRMEID